MLPVIFCPSCQSYLGSQAATCSKCGRARLPSERLPEPGQPLWQANLESAVHAAIVSGDLVIFNTGERSKPGGLFALDRHSGELRWSCQSRYSVEAGVALSADHLYFATCGLLGGGAELACLETKTGRPLWKQELAAGAWSTPLVIEARLYIGQDDGRVRCYDSRNGTPLCYQPVELPRGRLWLEQVDGLVLALSNGGQVLALDPNGLQRAWHTPLDVGCRISSPPCVSAGRVSFGGDGGQVMVLDVRTRTVSVLARGLGSVVAAPACDGGLLFVGGHDRHLHAYDLKSGQQLWQSQEFAHSLSSAPFACGGLVVAGVNQFGLVLLEAPTGELAWQFPVAAQARLLSHPILHDGVIFAGTDTGQVFALPWHLGQHAWAAKHLKALRHFHQAGIHYASAGTQARSRPDKQAFHAQAEDCWNELGQSEWAARLWEGLAEDLKAAEAYEQAAEALRGPDNHQAAEYYYAASRLYWRLEGFQAKADTSARTAARLGLWPDIRLKERNNPTLTQGKPGLISIRAENIGYGSAQNLCLNLGGSLLQLVTCQVSTPLAKDSYFDISLEVVATKPLSGLKIEAEYTGGQPRPTPFSSHLEMSIEAATPPKAPSRIHMGDQLFGKIKIVNPRNEPVEIDMGDGFRNEVEIVLDEERPAPDAETTCPQCGASVPPGAGHCIKCGKKLE